MRSSRIYLLPYKECYSLGLSDLSFLQVVVFVVLELS